MKTSIKCKICSSDSFFFGICDFNKNCEERKGYFLPISGKAVYYFKCSHCGLIFTTYFDKFSPDMFEKEIYNKDYKDVDPDFEELRPNAFATLLLKNFNIEKNLDILDYGCGDGKFIENLTHYGFSNVKGYDPYSKEFFTKPQNKFSLISSFEVFEHVTDPIELIKDIISLKKPKGTILFSTLLTPKNIDQIGVNWWYISPRNSHITIYTQKSLSILFSHFGMKVKHFNQNLHLAY